MQLSEFCLLLVDIGGVTYTLEVPLGESHVVVYNDVVVIGTKLLIAGFVCGTACGWSGWICVSGGTSCSVSDVGWICGLGSLFGTSVSPFGESRKITEPCVDLQLLGGYLFLDPL